MLLALTLMVPFKQIDIDAALPDAFAQHNLNWAKYLVAIGALTGMTTSLVREPLTAHEQI